MRKELGQLTAESIRRQALELADNLRKLAAGGKAEADKVASEAEALAGQITTSIDEFATHTERLMTFCQNTRQLAEVASGTVKEQTAKRSPIPPDILAEVEKAIANAAHTPREEE